MGTIIAELALNKSIFFGKFRILITQKSLLGKKLTIIDTEIAIQSILNYLLDENNYVS